MVRLKGWLGLLIIVIAFGAITFFVRQNAGIIKNFVEDHPIGGLVIYIGFGVLDSTVAPGSMFALIPVAGKVWGPLWAALLTIIGWTWGGFTAFYVAQRYGYPAVRKFVDKKHLEAARKYMPDKNLFWSVILLRLTLPLDLVSYAVGVFTDMPAKSYLLATVMGIAPGAIMLSYLGELPPIYEYLLYAIGAVVFIGFVRFAGKILM